MDITIASLGIDEVTLHHDLLVELGRVELAMDQLTPDRDDPTATQFQLLEARRAKLNAMLSRLAA